MIGLSRCSLHYQRANRDDDELRLALIRLAKQYGRYGYRKIAELLRIEGWKVNHKKVERIWREEGLQLPQRHKKRRRLYHKDSFDHPAAADPSEPRLEPSTSCTTSSTTVGATRC